MELDLKNFERDRADENIEWWIFNPDTMDYAITLNKENLSKILDWEELKTELYWGWEWINLRELEKWVRKDLTFCLMSDSERIENFTEVLPIGNTKGSEKVKIKIHKNIIETLLNFERKYTDAYPYRYDGCNKMDFYVSESFNRENLKDNIDFVKKIYNLTYPKNEE